MMRSISAQVTRVSRLSRAARWVVVAPLLPALRVNVVEVQDQRRHGPGAGNGVGGLVFFIFHHLTDAVGGGYRDGFQHWLIREGVEHGVERHSPKTPLAGFKDEDRAPVNGLPCAGDGFHLSVFVHRTAQGEQGVDSLGDGWALAGEIQPQACGVVPIQFKAEEPLGDLLREQRARLIGVGHDAGDGDQLHSFGGRAPASAGEGSVFPAVLAAGLRRAGRKLAAGNLNARFGHRSLPPGKCARGHS